MLIDEFLENESEAKWLAAWYRLYPQLLPELKLRDQEVARPRCHFVHRQSRERSEPGRWLGTHLELWCGKAPILTPNPLSRFVMSRTKVEAHSDPLPDWIQEPPAYFHEPPIRQQVSALPFDKMYWPDFERLVLRVAKAEVGVHDCRVYGRAGEQQDGIDLLVLFESGQVACVQCKKVASFGPRDILKAVEKFERGVWASEAISFTLCVATALESTRVTRAIKDAHQRLARRGVVFRIWDASASAGLNDRLKALPDIVKDFFGPGWVELFNGIDPTSSFGSVKRSNQEVAQIAGKLRLALSDFLAKSRAGADFGPLGEVRRPDLDRHLEVVVSGSQGHAVVVHGEEGTGKSTALASWLRELKPSTRWVIYASAAEALAHARSLDELANGLLASRLGIDEKAAARLQQRCPRETDLVIIDGLNERGEPNFWANLLTAATSTATSNFQLLVVTRTEHLARMRESCRSSSGLGEESALQVHEVIVGDFGEEQVRTLLANMGDRVKQVPKYLRRPRLLQLAARHMGRIRALSTVTYATLQLLELESKSASPDTFLDDLSGIAAREATRANLPSGMSSFLEQLAVAQQSTTFRLDAWMEKDEERAWLVIGLWLRERLMSCDAHGLDGFVEIIEQQMGSSQFDARASILEYATTAALLDPRTSRSMRLALIDRWLNCRNCVRSPLGALGRLLALAPDDVLDGIERALADGRETDLVVDILLDALQGLSRVAILRRVSTWLGLAPVKFHCFSAKEPEDLSEEIKGAASRGWPVTAARGSSSNARTVALHLFLARPDIIDRGTVTSAVASVALNSTDHDEELLLWALRRDDRDHRPAFDKLSTSASIRPRTARELDRLRHGAYPDIATAAQFGQPGESWNIWYIELQRLALNPSWVPGDADPRFLEITEAKSSIFEHDRRGQTPLEHAFDGCRAALALHRASWLRAFLSEWVDRYAHTGVVNPIALRHLADLAPLLSSPDLSLLRRHARGLRPMVNAGDESARNAVTLLTEFDLHHQSTSRRLLTLVRFMPEKALTSQLIEMVEPDADQTTWLAKQLSRRPQEGRRISFILRYCRAFSTQAVDSVKDWLGSVDCRAMSDYVLKNTLILAWRVGADDFIRKNASSSNSDIRRWSDDLKSLEFVANPDLPVRDVILHSSPDHWSLWCRNHAVGQRRSQAIAEVLAFVAGVGGPSASVVDGIREVEHRAGHETEKLGTLDKQLAARLQSLRETSLWRFGFHGLGLKYWATLIPEHGQVWLEASDEQVLSSFDVFTAWVDASKAAPHSKRREFIERRWRLEARAHRHSNIGFLRASVAAAFTLSDRESEALWDEMLDMARDDAELLRVVTAAVKGTGVPWLRRVIDTDRQSPHAFRCARAEVIAAMAGLPSHRVQPRTEASGWLTASIKFAKDLERSREWVSVWYRRFRVTNQASVRVGAWSNLTLLADVHFLEVVRDKNLYYSESSRVYERLNIADLRRTTEKRQERMAKSLLGLPLPSGNVGWLSIMRRRV